MHYLLVASFVLGQIHVSAQNMITQKPRFIGVKTGSHVVIKCLMAEHKTNVQWYKAADYGQEKVLFKTEESIDKGFQYLILPNVQVENSGVYYCRLGDTEGPGTQLIVVRNVGSHAAQHRTRVKEGLIIFQALMLAVFIAALLMHYRNLSEKKDNDYETPVNDHTYQGLDGGTCGEGLYEELTIYAQPDGAEAPWE